MTAAVIDHLPPGVQHPNATTMVSDDGVTQTWVTTDAHGNVVGTDQHPTPGSVAAVSSANSASLRTKAVQALAGNVAFLANAPATLTQAQVRDQVILLTKEATGVIRLLLDQLDSTAGT